MFFLFLVSPQMGVSIAAVPWLLVLPRGQRCGWSYPPRRLYEEQHAQPHHYTRTEVSPKPFPKSLSSKSKKYARVSQMSSLSSSAAASFQKTGVINTALPGPGYHFALCFLHANSLLPAFCRRKGKSEARKSKSRGTLKAPASPGLSRVLGAVCPGSQIPGAK